MQKNEIMPGGNGNIRPEDGKQFSSEYQPQEKWTEKKALKIGTDLIEWLKSKETNIFFEDFLYLNNDYYEELISYLCKKFTSFLNLINKARKIQEIKLIKYSVFNKLNANMTRFVLTNCHGMTEKMEQKIDSAPIIQMVDVRGKKIKKKDL